MINVRSGREAYSMSFTTQNRVFGPDDIRMCVEVKIHTYIDQRPFMWAEGIAICHPLDQFDLRKGLHKALESALGNGDFAKPFHTEVERWFQQDGQDV